MRPSSFLQLSLIPSSLPSNPTEYKPSSRQRRRLQKSSNKPANVCLNTSSAFPCAHQVTDRVQKLKDARAEASKEIEEYKKAKEQEFKAFESSVCPTNHFPQLGLTVMLSMLERRRTLRQPSTRRLKSI
jgi:hypothetical protein